ncbi:hypothetical protein AMECASPLE_009366 [Ameca splendens]|uniref:Uncharacterized protein n=1 Tax=Ameca splendens TaxID=208324 RepID=A0ABV0ZLR7_9TELE
MQLLDHTCQSHHAERREVWSPGSGHKPDHLRGPLPPEGHQEQLVTDIKQIPTSINKSLYVAEFYSSSGECEVEAVEESPQRQQDST